MRPAVSQAVIERVCTALDTHAAVNLVVPVTDTLLEVDENGTTAAMPARARFRRVQTPQGFQAATLQHAYEVALTDPNFKLQTIAVWCFAIFPMSKLPWWKANKATSNLPIPKTTTCCTIFS